MPELRIGLFGKLSIHWDGLPVDCLDVAKAQELLCYLLIYRARPHPREALAGLLWGDSSSAQSRKYLRQVLWQLHACLDRRAGASVGPVVLLDADWIQINPEAALWLDVDIFEQAYSCVQGVPGRDLDTPAKRFVEEAVVLYQGDLLEGWYQDWCIFERQRFQTMYLAMLDKLMAHCEAHEDYEPGIEYGMRILRYDYAHERTHRSLMRLHYRAGDRIAAMRQYERCVEALRDELNVAPSRQTVALYERIRGDVGASSARQLTPDAEPGSAEEALGQLREILSVLGELQQQVSRNIRLVEQSLDRQA